MEGGVLPGVWSCWPFLKADYGTQHMKFMLLFYKDGRMRMGTSLSKRSLRRSGHLKLTSFISPTVISTGNLNDHDWDFIENVRKGQLSSIDPLADCIPFQTVWVQDFRPKPALSKETSEFGQEWVAILKVRPPQLTVRQALC